MAATLISVNEVLHVVGETETEIESVNEALIERPELLSDREIRGGNVAPAVADARMVLTTALALLSDSDLISCKSASFDGSTVAGVKEAMLEEQEVYTTDTPENVTGGGLLISKDDVAIVVRPLLTLLADDADNLFFDGGIAAGDAGTIVLTSASKGGADITITAANMVAAGWQPVRLPGHQVPRVQAGLSFLPTQETTLTITGGGHLIYGITAGVVCDLEITVPTPLVIGTLTLTNMVPRGLQQIRLPGQQTPRIACGRRFTPTAESVITRIKGVPA
jgi:hypothetical protein